MHTARLTSEALSKAIATLKGLRVIKTVQDVCDATGYKKGNVSKYISGKVEPSAAFQVKFQEVYGSYLQGNKVAVIGNPDTYTDLITEYEKTIMELREQIAMQKKYIAMLERNQKTSD